MRLGRRSERGLFVFVVMMVLAIFTVIINGCGEDNPGIPSATTDSATDTRTNRDGTTQPQDDASTNISDTGTVTDTGRDAPVDAPSTPFNVTQAHSTTSTRMTVTFDAPPNAAQAVVLANYDVPGLTLSGTPSLVGNTVTITTSAQAAQSYTVTVTGVTRASDARVLTTNTATFTGRAPFNVVSAASTNNVTMTVTFDAPPNTTNGVLLTNYSVSNGLTLSGTPTIAGNTVTITTSPQTAQSYTVTVNNVTRNSDGEPLTTNTATFTGSTTFNVASAQATGNTTVTVTYDAPPNNAQATTLTNYDIPGLVLSGLPTLTGNVVTLTTSAQLAQSYTVTVTGVTRASDGQALGTAAATFNGRTTFNVTAAAATSATAITVTFDSPPDAAQAAVGNYAVTGLTLSNPVLAGSVVTLTTTAQAAQAYTVTVTGVTRAADAEPLTVSTADFTGRAPFNVTGAASTSSTTMTVTFDAAPNAAQATDPASYVLGGGIVVAGVPVLAGNTVTINTSGQTGATYTVTVTGVTRDSDAEPLTINEATFTGTPVVAPTVVTATVSATAPNNGTTPYNTGTATVVITGTSFATVDCAAAVKGVRVDDQDGVGVAVGTTATACTVDSDTQITATFPAGIMTNGTIGWNVIVTNTGGSNTVSAQRFIPLAGLLISEVLIGTGAGADHEFVEVYNPTATPIDTTTATGIGLRLHVRNGAAAPSDTNKTLTAVTTGVIPSHGFLLYVSADSNDPNDDAGLETWLSKADYTFTDGLVSNGAVYISLSATDQLRIIDKVGWGAQAFGGFEGTPTGDIPSSASIERKPAAGAGHMTDTDDNLSDFNAPSLTLTPQASVDPPQP